MSNLFFDGSLVIMCQNYASKEPVVTFAKRPVIEVNVKGYSIPHRILQMEVQCHGSCSYRFLKD